ncbi:MAG: FAD-dependent oxidoreductase [Bacteriovoracaceae bacterium]|nr:FAD-dependent oxidoreductase [Bacteriovoracaceae bacterium]
MKTLVMVGAGHSNLIAINALVGNLQADIRIVLVSDVLKAPYSGMLPGFMAGYYEEDQIVFDLKKISESCGISFIHAEVKYIHTASSKITLSTGEVIGYDCLSVNTGIHPHKIKCDHQGEEHLIYVKPLSRLIPKWTHFLKEKSNLQIAVIGAGSAGCEIAAAISIRTGCKITLFTKNQEILPELPESARKKARTQLRKLDIQVQTQTEVVSYLLGNIICDKGHTFSANYVFVTTGAVPNPIPGNLKCDPKGFLITNEKLLVEGADNIFATGDCISFNNHPLPKAGVYAVRQGKVLAINIQAYFSRLPMVSYKPQKKFLKILLIGNKLALATRGHLSIMNRLAWILKVYLDKKFMKRYQR